MNEPIEQTGFPASHCDLVPDTEASHGLTGAGSPPSIQAIIDAAKAKEFPAPTAVAETVAVTEPIETGVTHE